MEDFGEVAFQGKFSGIFCGSFSSRFLASLILCQVEPQASRSRALLANNAYPAIFMNDPAIFMNDPERFRRYRDRLGSFKIAQDHIRSQNEATGPMPHVLVADLTEHQTDAERTLGGQGWMLNGCRMVRYTIASMLDAFSVGKTFAARSHPGSTTIHPLQP